MRLRQLNNTLCAQNCTKLRVWCSQAPEDAVRNAFGKNRRFVFGTARYPRDTYAATEFAVERQYSFRYCGLAPYWSTVSATALTYCICYGTDLHLSGTDNTVTKSIPSPMAYLRDPHTPGQHTTSATVLTYEYLVPDNTVTDSIPVLTYAYVVPDNTVTDSIPPPMAYLPDVACCCSRLEGHVPYAPTRFLRCVRYWPSVCCYLMQCPYAPLTPSPVRLRRVPSQRMPLREMLHVSCYGEFCTDNAHGGTTEYTWPEFLVELGGRFMPVLCEGVDQQLKHFPRHSPDGCTAYGATG
eukprot:3756826-Rhodomonas_salina.2